MRPFSLQPLLLALLGLTLLLLSTAWFVTGLLLGLAAVWLPGLAWLVWLIFGEQWQAERPLPWVEPLLALLLTLGGAGSVAAANVLGTAAAGTTAVPLVPAYLGMIGLLLVWDLSRFQRRLADAATAAQQRALLVGHGRPLLLLVAVALLALAVGVVRPFTFDFDWALASAIILLYGLSFLLRLARDEIQ